MWACVTCRCVAQRRQVPVLVQIRSLGLALIYHQVDDYRILVVVVVVYHGPNRLSVWRYVQKRWIMHARCRKGTQGLTDMTAQSKITTRRCDGITPRYMSRQLQTGTKEYKIAEETDTKKSKEILFFFPSKKAEHELTLPFRGVTKTVRPAGQPQTPSPSRIQGLGGRHGHK